MQDIRNNKTLIIIKDEQAFQQNVPLLLLGKWCDAVRSAEKALGKVTYDLTEKQKSSRTFSRSLFVIKDMKKGNVFTEENVRSIRPGYGLAPKYLNEILGKKAKKELRKGTPLNFTLIV